MVLAEAETHSRDPRAWGKQQPGGRAWALGPNLLLGWAPAAGATFLAAAWLSSGCFSQCLGGDARWLG